MDWEGIAVIIGLIGAFIPEPITTIAGLFILGGAILSAVIG